MHLAYKVLKQFRLIWDYYISYNENEMAILSHPKHMDKLAKQVLMQ